MSGELLHVLQRPTDRRDLQGRVSDEGSPSAVAGAADKAKVPIPSLEHVHDSLRRRRQTPLGADYVRPGEAYHPISVFDQRKPALLMLPSVVVASDSILPLG